MSFVHKFPLNRVICKVRRLEGENDQFWHYQGIKCVTGNEILQKEMTGTQTSLGFCILYEDVLQFKHLGVV
jgi:hypothetical protein